LRYGLAVGCGLGCGNGGVAHSRQAETARNQGEVFFCVTETGSASRLCSKALFSRQSRVDPPAEPGILPTEMKWRTRENKDEDWQADMI
jgi:hypothetical protein